MPHQVVLPPLSETCESAILLEWLNRADGSLQAGDALVAIETDKAVAELRSPVDGVLAWQVFGPQSRVNVGETLAVIALPEEDASAVLEDAKRRFPFRSAQVEQRKPAPSFLARLFGLKS